MSNKDDDREQGVKATNWREYLVEVVGSYRVFLWAWRILLGREAWAALRPALIAVFGTSALAMAAPLAVAGIIDGLVAGDWSAVLWSLAALAAIRLTANALDYVYDRNREMFFGVMMGLIERKVNELFFEKSLGQHLAESGKLSAANVERGYHRAAEMVFTVMNAAPVIGEIAVIFGLLWYLSPYLGFIGLVILTNYFVWTVIMNRRINVDAVEIEEQWRALGRRRMERWDNVERVKTNGKERVEIEEIMARYGKVVRDDRRLWMWVWRVIGGRSAFNSAIILIVTGLAAREVMLGRYSVGSLFPLLVWVNTFGAQISQLGRLERHFTWCAQSVRSMLEAVTLDSDVSDALDAVPVPSAQPRIEFDRVTFGYRSEKTGEIMEVLKNVSFTVEPGERVALIGPSGSGKSTVVKLIQRYSDPQGGEIRVGGLPLTRVSQESWRSRIGYIPQSSQVLSGSVRYNLYYGLPESASAAKTDDETWELMRRLAIDFEGRLTEGLETQVGKKGLRLSGGEGQRLMVGSAVAKEPDVMLVDEATSSLDSTTERQVQAGLTRSLNGHASAVVIAHRLSTVREGFDKYILLRPASQVPDGESQVEAVAGSMAELYAESPTFRRLADDQGISVAY